MNKLFLAPRSLLHGRALPPSCSSTARARTFPSRFTRNGSTSMPRSIPRCVQLPGHWLRRRPEANPLRDVDFGASDGPMSDENLAKAPRPLWHIPTVAGAVVVTYNVPGNPKLRLDGPTLAASFSARSPSGMTPRSPVKTAVLPFPARTSSWCTAPMAAARASSSPITSAT